MDNNVNNTQKVMDINDKTISYINPNLIDKSSFALNLFGVNISEIAVELNENFIRLAQSFYGSVPPHNPVIGQFWFNKDDLIQYRWLGYNWVQIERDTTFDCFMYIKYNISASEFIIDESVFNFTIENIRLYNQDMDDVKFIIDPFDSKKIILKDFNVTDLYILIFHPKDRISNPYKNKKIEVFTSSGQTQFDIESFLNGSNTNTLSVDLNGVMVKNSEFSIVNNILTLDGKIYRIRNNDKLTIWKHGGSLDAYYSNLHINVDKRTSFIRIPKFFKKIINCEFVDNDSKTSVNPIIIDDLDDYLHFEFMDKKLLTSDVKVRII